MSTSSSYFKNVVKLSKTGSTKRRLSNEEESDYCNNKKRALSLDNGECSVDISQNVKETETRTPSCKFDDCFNEETFINNFEVFKPMLDLSSVAELCSTEEFSQLQPSTTQAISHLTSQPYIGLIEQDKLTLLLNFLLKLYQSEGAFPKFQEKSKIWAITQLKKSLCLPTSVLYEKEYLHPATLQTAITKVVAVIASEKCKNQKIPNEIIRILILVGLIALKMPVLPPPSFIESILQIFYENKPPFSILQELLELLNMLIIEDKVDVNSESLAHFWTLHPSSLEDTVVDILIENKTKASRRMVRSKLGQACCHNSLLFQKIVNMFVTAWLQTGGHSSVADTLSKFVCLVQNACTNTSLFSLFPNSLWPIALLLQIPVTDLSPTMQKLHAYSIIETLSETISTGLCQVKDIVILFLIFPSWYQVLHNLCTTEPSSNNGALKLLMNTD